MNNDYKPSAKLSAEEMRKRQREYWRRWKERNAPKTDVRNGILRILRKILCHSQQRKQANVRRFHPALQGGSRQLVAVSDLF